MLLFELTRSGLRSNKGTFIGLALLMVLTSATLVFALCAYSGLNERQAQAMTEANAGDVLIISSAAEITDGFIDAVEDLGKVGEVHVGESIAASTSYRSEDGKAIGEENVMNVTYQPWSDAIDFNVFSDNDGTMSLVPRREATPPAPDEAYIPIGCQATLGLQLGDTIIVRIGDDEHDLKVGAFIEEPQLGSPFVEMAQYLVSDSLFADMLAETEKTGSKAGNFIQQSGAGTAYAARTLNISMTEAAREAGMTTSQFAEYINEGVSDTESITTGFLSADTLTNYAMLVVIISCAVFLVFALLLYIIALVICFHTISTAIQENYVDFAILKAVGVPNGTIRRSLVIQYVISAAIGTLIGAVVGAILTMVALPLFASLTGVLAQANMPYSWILVALIGLLLIIAASVTLKTRRIARIAPLTALRSGTSDVHFKSRAMVSAAGRPLSMRLAWRAVTSAKRNYIGLFACALMLGVFVMFTFGIGSSLNTMEDSYKAFGTWMSDVSVKLPDDIDLEEVEDVISEASPIERIWQERFAMQNMDGESRSIVGLSDFAVSDGIAEGRAPEHPNEVVIGYKLAEYKDIEIGDELMLTSPSGEERPYLVSGLLSAMFNAGYGILMTYDGMEELGYTDDQEDRSYQIRLMDPSAADRARELLGERFGDDVETTNTGIFASTQDLMVIIHDMFIVIGYSMDIVAVLLVFLAATLIIGRMFSMERRDLGIYRALGFTPLNLRTQFALRFLIVSLLGCVVAAILVSLGGSWVASQLFGTFGVTKFAIDTSLPLIGGLGIGLALVFFIAAFWGARKVRRISVNVLITE